MYNQIANTIIDGFTYPFNPKIFFTIRGCENVHIYFWILKDIGWIFNNKITGVFFGTCALIWLIILAYNYNKQKDYEEIYFLLPTFLWLFANYLWMFGNLIYDTDVFRFGSSCIMMFGLILIIYYFAFLKKKNYFLQDFEKTQSYSSNGLVCRFKSIGGWRRYEFIHMFFWLLKDYCWCSQDKIMWLGGAIPTIYISIDLIITTCKNKGLFVDLIHYISQLIWVFSNITWAFSELFYLDSDTPPNYYERFNHKTNGRTIASIILIISWFPIIMLYFIWLPLTVSNKINSENTNENITYNEIHLNNEIVVNNNNNNDNNDNNIEQNYDL